MNNKVIRNQQTKHKISYWIKLITLFALFFINPIHPKNNKKKPRLKKDFFLTLTSRGDGGVFSIFDDVLDIAKRYEMGLYPGFEVDFGTRGLYYDQAHGKNWWSYYCQPLCVGNKIRPQVKKGGPPYIRSWNTDSKTRQEVFRLIQKYIFIQPHIQDKIDAFVKANFENSFVISVHYRGTDKISEASRVSYKKIPQEILKVVETNKLENYKIFIATDEQNFLDYMNNIFGPIVCYVQDAIRAQKNKPIHIKSCDPYKCGLDAIVDSVLLSKANFLIKSISNLSRWTTYFNPNLPFIELGQIAYLQQSSLSKNYAKDPYELVHKSHE